MQSLIEDEGMASLISPRDAPNVSRIMAPDTIYVAPLSLVETAIEDARVSHLVTLINGETLVPTPASQARHERHLRASEWPRAALRGACRRSPPIRSRLGPQRATAHSLLGRHQPLDCGGLPLTLRAQPRS